MTISHGVRLTILRAWGAVLAGLFEKDARAHLEHALAVNLLMTGQRGRRSSIGARRAAQEGKRL